MPQNILPCLLALGLVFAVEGLINGQNFNQAPNSRVDSTGDPLPVGALARLGANRGRHIGPISGVRFSPDGQIIASVGFNSPVRISDASSGSVLRQFPLEESRDDMPFGCEFSPNGAILAVASERVIFLRNPVDGSVIHRFKGLRFRGIAWSPNGKTLATMSLILGVELWDVASGNQIATLGGGFNGLSDFIDCAVAFSPDGRLIASCLSSDMYLWDTASRKQIHRVKLSGKGVTRVAFSPNGRILAAGENYGKISLWDVAAFKEIRTFKGHSGVTAVAFSPDGTILAGGSMIPFDALQKTATPPDDGRRLRLWDVATGKEIAQLGEHAEGVSSLSISPAGTTLIASSGNATHIYDLSTSKEIRPGPGHTISVYALAISSDGRQLISGGGDHSLRIWDPATGRAIRQLLGSNGSVTSLSLSAREPLLAAACSDGVIRFWDLSKPNSSSFIDLHQNAAGQPWFYISIAFSPDGKQLASISELTPATLWDVTTKKKISVFGEGKLEKPCIAYSPDGKYLATGTFSFSGGMPGAEGTRLPAVRLWNIATGKEGPSLHDQGPRAEAVTFSPDGTFLAASTLFGVAIWETATGKLHAALKVPNVRQHKLVIASGKVVFSPDGRMIASTGEDKSARVWELLTGQARCEFTGHRSDELWAAAINPAGTLLATGGDDTTVLLWDLTGTPRRMKSDETTATDLQRCWDELAGNDAAVAFDAIWSMIRSPDKSILFLKNRLSPAPRNPISIPELLVQLNSNSFTTRQQATSALQARGESAKPAMRKALSAKPPLEVRRRLEQLLELKSWPITNPTRLQSLRAVEVLEHIGFQALPVLGNLAEGDPDDLLTIEASKTVRRLKNQ